MNSKRLAAIGLTAAGITLGTTVIAPVANATPAHAVTTSSCRITYIPNGTYPGLKVQSCYYDYNWWEESWMGGSHRDGRYYVPVPVYA